jgi:Kyakuja-Dileera-Zisupton transposase
MLCQHDIPLLLANMWTAGEKQFYVFTLLDALIKHLPDHWRIGALYDIAAK